MAVFIEVNTVELAVPVATYNFPGVVFEQLDNPPVLPVPIEFLVVSICNVHPTRSPGLKNGILHINIAAADTDNNSR